MAKVFTTKTEEEIKKEIKRICSDDNNFTSDNYGSEAADNGFFEVHYSFSASENTLENFVKWLFDKK